MNGSSSVENLDFLKCVLFFPKCPRFLVDISEDVPVFLKSIRALVIPHNEISSVMIFHCAPVLRWMLRLAVHICGTVPLPCVLRTMILIAFQDVRPVIFTVFGNIAFFLSLSSILIFWHILRTCVVGFLFLISYKINYIYIYIVFISESVDSKHRFRMPKLWK
jgi:hypothetical protein